MIFPQNWNNNFTSLAKQKATWKNVLEMKNGDENKPKKLKRLGLS
jgi:hypothetical protein